MCGGRRGVSLPGMRTTCTAVAAALLVAGCGGSSDAHRLTHEQFVAKAQTICRSTDKQLEQAARAIGPHHMSETLFVETRVRPIVSRSVEQLSALVPARADEADVEALVAAGRRALRTLAQNPNSVRADEGSAGDPFRDFTRRARAFGVAC
jgi:hypothetical protein